MTLDGRHGAAARTVLDRVDGLAELAFDRVRGIGTLDGAALALSAVSDRGMVWVAVAACKARGGSEARRRSARSLLLAGTASFGVNAVVKAAVGRRRPAGAASPRGQRLLRVRTPTSSSFPSGHTLAAFCTAVVLADTLAEGAAFVGFAASVAASRVHLRAHHASDVVGGAIIGASLGAVVRRVRVPVARRGAGRARRWTGAGRAGPAAPECSGAHRR